MDFEALQRQRKSCRAFAPKPVPRELLTRLVDTARLSPSACNSQPWHFIVVDEDETPWWTMVSPAAPGGTKSPLSS